MCKPSSILITGVSGFIGQHLAYQLIKSQHHVVGLDIHPYASSINGLNFYLCDFSSLEKIQNIITKESVDCIIHLAAYSRAVSSEDLFTSNSVLTLKMLELSQTNQITLMAMSSSAVYGEQENEKKPLTENTQLNPINLYGVSKLTVENLLRLYSKNSSCRILGCRPFNVIGPGQSDDFFVSRVAKSIAQINKNIATAHSSQLIVSDLDSYRDYIDVRDLVRAIELILKKGENGNIYNISSGNATQCKAVVNYYTKLAQTSVKVIVQPQNHSPISYQQGSSELLYKQTGWKPKISLNESLNDIYDFWMNKGLNQ